MTLPDFSRLKDYGANLI